MEIQEERDKQALSGEEIHDLGDGEDNGIVLVACKDEYSCMQLEDCITNGSQKVFLRSYLFQATLLFSSFVQFIFLFLGYICLFVHFRG